MMTPLEIIEKIAKGAADKFNFVAMFFVIVMLIGLVIDILGTKFFQWPLPGSVDLIGESLLLVGAFGVAQTQVLKKHIHVDFLIMRLPVRIQNMLNCISAVFGFMVFLLIFISSVQYTKRLYLSGETTFNLQWPMYPIPAILAFTCLPVLIVFIWEFFHYLKGDRKKCH